MDWKSIGIAIIGGLLAKTILSGKKDGIAKEKSNGNSHGNKEKLYQVTIKGTVQANGPLSIRKTVVMDEKQARLFCGANRYEAMEGWIHANYPGAKIRNIRDFAAEIKPLKS